MQEKEKEEKMKEMIALEKKMENMAGPRKFVVKNPDTGMMATPEEEDEMFRNYRPGFRNIDDNADQEFDEWSEAKDAFNELTAFRGSLDPPSAVDISPSEFLDGSKTDYVHLGRPLDLQTRQQKFRGTLWMHKPEKSSKFPLKVSDISPILELVGMGSQSHMKSLHDFFTVRMPDGKPKFFNQIYLGFPIQVEIPIGYLPLSALIKFQNIKDTCDDENGTLFDIPSTYSEGEVIGANLEQYKN